MQLFTDHNITPDAADSFKKSHKPANASMENPFHVSGHPPHATYPYISSAVTHQEKLSVSAVPINPKCNLDTKSQLTNRCTMSATPDMAALTKFFNWHCKNRWSGKRKAKEKCRGMNQMETVPAMTARSSGCPNQRRIGVAKKYIGRRRIPHKKSTIHDLCMYTPSMWYFFAPNAWPHSVSSALAIPSCNSVGTVTC